MFQNPDTVTKETERQSEIETISAFPTFQLIDGFPEFIHSAVVYVQGGKYFRGVVYRHVGNETPGLEELVNVTEIPMCIFPQYEDKFGPIVTRPGDSDYVKRPDVSDYDGIESDRTSELMHGEAAMFNVFRKNPHRHISGSRGCFVTEGRVTAFCLPRLAETLGGRMKRVKVSKEECMPQIRSAVRHVHDLGLAHNDINPENIMFDANDTPKLIDFDACGPIGQKLIKLGTPKWNSTHRKTSCKENDLAALDLLEQYIENGAPPGRRMNKKHWNFLVAFKLLTRFFVLSFYPLVLTIAKYSKQLKNATNKCFSEEILLS